MNASMAEILVISWACYLSAYNGSGVVHLLLTKCLKIENFIFLPLSSAGLFKIIVFLHLD